MFLCLRDGNVHESWLKRIWNMFKISRVLTLLLKAKKKCQMNYLRMLIGNGTVNHGLVTKSMVIQDINGN